MSLANSSETCAEKLDGGTQCTKASGSFFCLANQGIFFSDGMVETLLKYIVIAHFFLLILYFAFF